jgi:aarF domain-containing kinase
MAGRRLIDAAKLFNASRSVVKQHINLRSQQLDVYSKTSTFAKTVKNQTDRVTLTAKAAVALAERFNGPPLYTGSAGKEQTSRSQDEPVPSKETVNSEDTHGRVKVGLEQDHHYDRSEQNVRTEPSPDEELGIKQEKLRRQPLPDGAISPPGTILESTKEPLAQERQSMGQDEDDGIKPVVSRASAIPTPSKASELSPEEARRLQRQAEFQIPSVAAEPQPSAPQPKAEKLSEGHDRYVFCTRSTNAEPEYSSLPRAKIPKNTEDKQGSDEHVENGQIHPDVFYSTPEAGQGSRQKEQVPHQAAIPGQEQVPKGINTDVFRTARVARMLGGNPYKDKTRLDLEGASGTSIDHTELAARKSQDTFNIRQTAATTPAKPEQIVWEGHQETPSAENEIRDFVPDLAKDVEATFEPLSEVGYSLPDPIASKAC